MFTTSDMWVYMYVIYKYIYVCTRKCVVYRSPSRGCMTVGYMFTVSLHVFMQMSAYMCVCVCVCVCVFSVDISFTLREISIYTCILYRPWSLQTWCAYQHYSLHLRSYIFICMYAYMHTRIRRHVLLCSKLGISLSTTHCICGAIYIYIYIHIYIYIYIHTHTHPRAYIHTQVLLFSKLGVPISTTHCICGATAAVGWAAGNAKAVNWKMAVSIFLGWIVTVSIFICVFVYGWCVCVRNAQEAR
jgi:hypothetical protein